MKYLNIVLLLVLPMMLSAQSVKVTPEDLNEWSFLGQGSKLVESHNMFFMKEDPNESNGVMIVSPKAFGTNVVVKYEVMAMTPATVLVAILSASDKGESTALTIPKKYDGSMSLWINDVESYFYAFRNAPHNYTPFIRKYPVPEGKDPALVSMDNNLMHCGIFHAIELGRKGDLLWLKIDGEKILETIDKNAFGGGHLALRIRGTAGEYGACLIKNMEITESK